MASMCILAASFCSLALIHMTDICNITSCDWGWRFLYKIVWHVKLEELWSLKVYFNFWIIPVIFINGYEEKRSQAICCYLLLTPHPIDDWYTKYINNSRD